MAQSLNEFNDPNDLLTLFSFPLIVKACLDIIVLAYNETLPWG